MSKPAPLDAICTTHFQPMENMSTHTVQWAYVREDGAGGKTYIYSYRYCPHDGKLNPDWEKLVDG